jgi:hypothetical protein
MIAMKSNTGLMSEIMRYGSRQLQSQTPPQSPFCRLQMRSGILHWVVQPTPFNARSDLILVHVAVRLPPTPTPAKNPQAQEGDEHKRRATVSIRGVEFGGGHWVEALSTTLSTGESFEALE